jgi:hypothetical protein
MFAGITFNCFYTVTNPVAAAQYNKTFSIGVILWNILFNLGFIYTDSKNILQFFYTVVNTPDNRLWNQFGTFVGDLVVRFIYSKYIQKTYYNF